MKIQLILTVLAATALVACGGEAETTATAPQPGNSSAAAQPATAAPEPTASIANQGRRRFGACAVCHTVNEGEPSRVGPNLFDIVGAPAGAVEGFAYSKAMREAGIVWTEDNLDAFIESPQNFMRGNRMGFVGERNPEYRAAVIAYLKTLKPADD